MKSEISLIKGLNMPDIAELHTSYMTNVYLRYARDIIALYPRYTYEDKHEIDETYTRDIP